jgi:ubiquitin-like modifier-activating enzyme ATG7
MAALSTSDAIEQAIEFQPLASAVDVSFWHALSAKKIDEFKLDSSAVPIACGFTTASHAAVPSRLSAGSFSFDTSFQTCDSDPSRCFVLNQNAAN